jgi:hypothetical protein
MRDKIIGIILVVMSAILAAGLLTLSPASYSAITAAPAAEPHAQPDASPWLSAVDPVANGQEPAGYNEALGDPLFRADEQGALWVGIAPGSTQAGAGWYPCAGIPSIGNGPTYTIDYALVGLPAYFQAAVRAGCETGGAYVR